MKLRRMTADQWRTWRDLRLAALADAPQAFAATLDQELALDEAQWRARLEPARGLAAVAYLGDTPAGIIGGYRPDPESVELVSMWVSSAGRGRGLGDGLVAEVVDWAAGLPVRLWVVEDNLVARNLYQRNGFRLTGESQVYVNDPSSVELRMVRTGA